MDLNGKIVVITGGSKGLGRSLAELLSKEGAKLAICSPEEEEILAVAKEIGCLGIRADVRREEEVKKLAELTEREFGRIDIWINNAGIRIPRVPLEDTDMKRVHEMVEVNLFGTMYGSKAAMIQMKKRKEGTIVNILSTSALEGAKYSTGYGASKGGAIAFTKSLRVELSPFGISVIGVYPKGMRTEFFRENKPADYEKYMDPREVARQIVNNLKKNKPEEEFFIKTDPSAP